MTVIQHLNFTDFDKLFVGFDRLNRDLSKRVANNPLTNYPRYNLVSVGEEAYRIEMALRVRLSWKHKRKKAISIKD